MRRYSSDVYAERYTADNARRFMGLPGVHVDSRGVLSIHHGSGDAFFPSAGSWIVRRGGRIAVLDGNQFETLYGTSASVRAQPATLASEAVKLAERTPYSREDIMQLVSCGIPEWVIRTYAGTIPADILLAARTVASQRDTYRAMEQKRLCDVVAKFADVFRAAVQP